jgi:hypothetical protein
MRKTTLILLGSVLLAGSAIQGAAAAERYKGPKAVRAPAPMSESVRNSNAYWPTSQAEADQAYYANRGLSVPAGR